MLKTTGEKGERGGVGVREVGGEEEVAVAGACEYEGGVEPGRGGVRGVSELLTEGTDRTDAEADTEARCRSVLFISEGNDG